MGDYTITVTPGTVEALQGNAVNSETLGSFEDGYVLTWDNTDGYWVGRPTAQPSSGGLSKTYFTSSGTWTCPTGVTNILVIAAGGGAGGGSGSGFDVTGGGGGGGSIQQCSYVSVTPGINYTITIGSGGNGGSLVNSGTIAGHNGSDGNPTIIAYSGTNYFYAVGGGAGGGGANVSSNLTLGVGGTSYPNAAGKWYLWAPNDGAYGVLPPLAAFGGWGGDNGSGSSGAVNYIGGYSAGTNPGASGGGGGGAGPQGVGANGGVGNTGGNANAGSNASANTGAGGGGGGAGAASGNSGAGGNGGSGYLYIIY